MIQRLNIPLLIDYGVYGFGESNEIVLSLQITNDPSVNFSNMIVPYKGTTYTKRGIYHVCVMDSRKLHFSYKE